MSKPKRVWVSVDDSFKTFNSGAKFKVNVSDPNIVEAGYDIPTDLLGDYIIDDSNVNRVIGQFTDWDCKNGYVYGYVRKECVPPSGKETIIIEKQCCGPIEITLEFVKGD